MEKIVKECSRGYISQSFKKYLGKKSWKYFYFFVLKKESKVQMNRRHFSFLHSIFNITDYRKLTKGTWYCLVWCITTTYICRKSAFKTLSNRRFGPFLVFKIYKQFFLRIRITNSKQNTCQLTIMKFMFPKNATKFDLIFHLDLLYTKWKIR